MKRFSVLGLMLAAVSIVVAKTTASKESSHFANCNGVCVNTNPLASYTCMRVATGLRNCFSTSFLATNDFLVTKCPNEINQTTAENCLTLT